MLYQSILGINKPEDIEPEKIIMPKYFYDLNLDLIVQDIMEEQKLYDLRRFYYYVAGKEDIEYRLAVLKDLDNERIYQSLVDFTIGIRKAKDYLGYISGTDIDLQKQKWKLDAAFSYITGVLQFKRELDMEDIASAGLLAFRNWLTEYVSGEAFLTLKSDTEKLMLQFDEMKFNLQIKRDRVIIHPGYLEEDYCKQLRDTFREETKELHYYQKNPFGTPLLSALEGAVLNVLKKPYAQTFRELSEFDGKYQDFINPCIQEFELESQFYISFCLYRKKMLELNYHFCYPTISNDREFRITSGYDLALAKKNAQLKKEIVYNDCYFNRGERFFVITGPNQGGKTTFARALGQIVYFASLGLAVPCSTAVIPAFDGIYTHFAVEENLDTGAGKLKEELLRLKDMMTHVTKNSFVIINEIFTSATSYDAYIMGKKVINYFMDEDCLGAYVTHIYELTKDDDRIVSLVAALLSEDSNIRTFKIERKPADGRSYANSIVEKYQMTYQEIKERIRR